MLHVQNVCSTSEDLLNNQHYQIQEMISHLLSLNNVTLISFQILWVPIKRASIECT